MQDNETQENTTGQKEYIKIKKFTFVMLIFVLVFATAGITMAVLSLGSDKKPNIVMQMQERKEFSKLYQAYDMLEKNYFTDIDREELINGAIDGMVKALGDPYSDYLTKEENEKFQESISASFEGIGAEIQERDGYITIVSPIKDSPAEKAGLLPNDKIISVDGQNIQGMSSSEAVLLIRGEKGTKVTLGILRGDQEIEITITRDTIPLRTVYAEMVEDGIAKIQLTSFSTRTFEELIEALNEMKSQGMTSLILDLRRNPGGLMDQALGIADLFVPKGKTIMKVEYRDGTITEYKAKGDQKIDVPIVILIDGGSASASEILAGAARESANIPLVGENSFGKGTVQSARDFPDKSNLKFTIAKWLTPNGNWIHEKGISPDYEVKLPEYAFLPYINPDNEYQLSSVSDEVKAAEQMLQVLGFDPGEIDGLFDENTENAIRAFQEKENLTVNGILSGDTTLQLMTKLSEHLQKEDPQVKKAVELLSENEIEQAS